MCNGITCKELEKQKMCGSLSVLISCSHLCVIMIVSCLVHCIVVVNSHLAHSTSKVLHGYSKENPRVVWFSVVIKLPN